MRNHLIRRQTPTPRNQGPVLLDHALCDDPPLLGRLLPDAPPDHRIPVPAHLSAGVEGVRVGSPLSDKSVKQYLFPDFWRQHLCGFTRPLAQLYISEENNKSGKED